MHNPWRLAALAATLALAAPTIGHAQGVPQVLQGLMTGNQNQDQAIRDAYERGYQKGRQDEAQLSRNRRSGNDDRQNSYPSRTQAPYDPRQQNDYRR